jgi:ABC-2 type transport system ATP-binding protein
VTTKAIEVHRVDKYFGKHAKRAQVLHGVELDISEGEAFGFVGANGAGKSTTIKIIMDIIRADSGSASIFGIDSRDPRARLGMSYVPENPYLYDYLTPYELVRMGIMQHRLNVPDVKQHCYAWLERFGIAQAASKRIRNLSKGMTQRTALAHALACKPRLLILDEPLSGLDPVGRREVVDILLDYRRDGGTLFFTSHVLYDVERIADRFALIDKGRIEACKTASDLFRSSQGLFDIYIEAPEPLEGYVHEAGQRWSRQVELEQLSELLQQIKSAGHSVLSITPRLTLEKLFLNHIDAEPVDL